MDWSATGACKYAENVSGPLAMGKPGVPPDRVNMRSKSMVPMLFGSHGGSLECRVVCEPWGRGVPPERVNMRRTAAAPLPWESLECHRSVQICGERLRPASKKQLAM